MSTTKPLGAKGDQYMLRKQKNLLGAKRRREQHKNELNSDKQIYDLLNEMLDSYYSPQKWKSPEFKHQDDKVVGTQKERNKISASNTRKRYKLMRNELRHRITVLEGLLEPSYFMIGPWEFSPPAIPISIHLSGVKYTCGRFVKGTTWRVTKTDH